MKAMLVDENKNLVWTEVETPKIKADEVLVRVCAAALNRADLLQRQGKYPSPPGCPEWMGLEIAGIVADTGEDVASWKVGDRVCALLGGGGYAEYAAVRRDMLMPVPKGLTLTEAASYCLWFVAVKRGSLSRLFIIKFAEPAFAGIFGALLLGEDVLSVRYLLCFLLICGGICISSAEKRQG